MKRLLLIVFYLTIATGFTVAQISKPSAYFGLKAGVCHANQNIIEHSYWGPWSPDTQFRIGLDAGVYMETPVIKDNLASILEIHYIQNGTIIDPVYTSDDLIGTWRQVYESDFLSIPILVKCRFPIGRITPYVLIGPRLDVFLHKGVKNEFSSPDAKPYGREYSEGYYSNQKFQKTVFGATAGLGIEVLLKGDFSLLLEFRSNHSFTDAVRTKTITIRNRSFQLLAGIRVPMRGIGIKVNTEKDRESF